jgi:hypothetical protein
MADKNEPSSEGSEHLAHLQVNILKYKKLSYRHREILRVGLLRSFPKSLKGGCFLEKICRGVHFIVFYCIFKQVFLFVRGVEGP